MTDIDAILAALEGGNIVAVTADSSRSGEWRRDLAAAISSTGSFLIYTAVTQPHTAVEKDLEARGVDMDNVFFIDLAADAGSDEEAVRAENCIFLKPGGLTHLSIAISNAVEAIPDRENTVVLIDGIDVLEMYNSSRAVSEFSHFLIGKLRGWGSKGVILSVEDGVGDQLRSHLSQFCDASITLDG